MSQRGVERTLGKMVTDPGFREHFLREPASAALAIGVELTPEETAALSRVPQQALAELSTRLDDRICKLHIRQEPSGQEQTK
jgi:hypothetical protein